LGASQIIGGACWVFIAVTSEDETGRESHLQIEVELMRRNARRAKNQFALAAVWLISSVLWLGEGAYRRNIIGVSVGIVCLATSACSLRRGFMWKNPHARTVYEGLRYPRRW
jgi:hypothetical protein